MPSVSIVEAVRRAGGALPPVVLFANRDYAPMLRNWAQWFNRIGAGGVVVVGYDQEVVDLAQDLGLAACLDQPAPGFHPAIVRRAGIVAELVAAGLDFVQSDLDLVWFSDPRPALLALDVDLAISPGTFWPPDVLADWGFVLCTGFFALRSTPVTIRLMREVALLNRDQKDDQAVTNRLIRGMGAKWQAVTPLRRAEKRMKMGAGEAFQFNIYDRPVFGEAGGMSIALLPETEYTRLDGRWPTTRIAHPLTPKTCYEKAVVMQRLGLWDGPLPPG